MASLVGSLHEAEGERGDREHQRAGAGQVGPGLRGLVAALAQHPRGREQRKRSHRQVDKEHQPPAALDEDAAEANRKGVAADLAYFAMTKPLDYYVMYTAHNYQFLAFSAAMEGRRAETIEAARQSRALVSDDMLLTMPGTDWYVAELYAALVRFGMWDEVLAAIAKAEGH